MQEKDLGIYVIEWFLQDSANKYIKGSVKIDVVNITKFIGVVIDANDTDEARDTDVLNLGFVFDPNKQTLRGYIRNITKFGDVLIEFTEPIV